MDNDFVRHTVRNLYKKELSNLILWKPRWKKIGNVCFATSKICVGIGLMFDFISAYYDRHDFTFVAGCSNTVALIMMSYGSYAFNEARKQSSVIKKIWKQSNDNSSKQKVFIHTESESKEAQQHSANMSESEFLW